jgi:syntaxin-binding protein 1
VFLPLKVNSADSSSPVQWKVLVVDETSRKLINGAVNEEEILNFNISSEPDFLSTMQTHTSLNCLPP